MKMLRLLFSLFLLAVFAQVAQAQNRMNFQGQLNNADGTPANGMFSVQFSIYNDSLGGAPLLTQTQRLAIAEGFFNTSLDVHSIRFDTLYWVGLAIDSGAELRPRFPLYSSPYSFSTRSLFGAENVVPSTGNAGFGTTDPTTRLHVVGDVRFENLDSLDLNKVFPVSDLVVVDDMGNVRRAASVLFQGIHCWDLNGNAIDDLIEDINRDGLFDVLDCQGDAFNGILNNIPLIIKDAQGDPQIQLNPDGDAQVNGKLTVEEAELRAARAIDEFLAEGGVNITGGVLTFPDGTTQNTAGGGGAFNGMLNNIPLIIKDAQGDPQIQLNPDGTSTHSGQESFSGGVVIKNANGDTVVTLDENGISVDEANKRIQAPATGLRLEGPFEFSDPPFFEDGFESGDTGTWSNTANGVDSRTDATAVRGENVQPNGVGVHGATTQTNSTGVLGEASDASSFAGRFEGRFQVNGDVDINGGPDFKVNISADVLFNGNTTLIGDSDMTGNATLTGTATLNGDAFMTGNATLLGDADMTGNATMTGNLDVGGDPLMGFGNTSMTGNLTVGGDAQLDGNLNVGGTFNALVKQFKIDHPLDPSGQYLVHTSVESPDMMTVYNGNVVLDADGAATVEMPSYFEALNKDFRYQLTAIGGFAPVYVAEEIAGNRFKIAGGTPGMKVSWQVTGVRHDPYAEAYRSPVEVEKPVAEQGTYLHPELYGASPAQHARRDGSDQR